MINNLDEAISHAREVAEYFTMKSNELYERQYKASLTCNECAKDNEQIAEWLTELKERREADRWIPISERLPKTPVNVLVQLSTDYITTGHCLNKSIWIVKDRPKGTETVTHWKPLPKPYESEEK